MAFWDIFRRNKKTHSIVEGITLGDARDKIKASWNWSGGWSGEKIIANSNPDILTNWKLNARSLRKRARQAYWDHTVARAIISRLLDNVVGTGLSLEAQPAWEIIEPDAERDTELRRRQWVRQVETRWDLWARSTEPDASGKMSLYGLQGFWYVNYLRDGEVFLILRYSQEQSRVSTLNIQAINPDQVRTPYDAAPPADRRIVDGVEIDPNGRETAIYVFDDTGKWTRVPVWGPRSGRRFVIHMANIDQVGQVRGVSAIAHIVHELKRITDYTVAELEAAVINATIAGWVKPSGDRPSSRPWTGITPRTHEQSISDEASSSTSPSPAQISIDRPGIWFQNLKAGEEIHSFDTKRPNVSYGEFVKAVKSSLASSLGIPVEVLDMSFNANYSASRASLLLFWNAVERWRTELSHRLLNNIYEAWMGEEVAAGRIRCPGWDTPVVRRSWLRCSWTGINKPSIDPFREARAVHQRLEDGLTTREREAKRYDGSEFAQNVERLKIENNELVEAKRTLEEIADGTN